MSKKFVENFYPEHFKKLFRHYESGCYLGLLPYLELSEKEQRYGLERYLESFDETDERFETLKEIVDSRDIQRLICLLNNDQYYQEPLYRSACIAKILEC